MTRVRRLAKALLQNATGQGRPSVLVASMGRSGSTLLHRAILEAVADEVPLPTDLARRVFSDTAWDLSTPLRPGVVYKTHDVARDQMDARKVRAVFLFGPASDAALSVLSCQERYGDAWVREHFGHLHAHGRADDLLHRDALGFERQIGSWTRPTSCSSFLLHYGAFWAHQQHLSDFPGLPERRSRRRHRLKYHVGRNVRAILQDLDALFQKLPNFRLRPAPA